MDMFINCFVLVTSIWLLAISLITNTKNFLSSLIFKVIPFFLGVACLLSGLKLFGWI